MEDINATKQRHGHYEGKALWWIDHVMVDGKPVTFMVMFGNRIIGDNACYRIGSGPEIFFEPGSVDRDTIIRKGKSLIQSALKGKKVLYKSGSAYDWQSTATES